MFDLSGKIALVTGSTQGIGFEIASVLAQQGARVFVNGASSMEKCQVAAERIPNSVPVLANVSKEEDIQKLYQTTGDVDILVLNASVQVKRDWEEVSLEEFDMQMSCNVRSSFLMIQKYAPGMKKKKWGRIVTIGSVNQYNQHPMLSVYSISKAAQMKMVENLAPLLAPFQVTINNIAPGAIDTPRNQQALANKEAHRSIVSRIPCGYIGKPEDVVHAVLLVCSEEGRYITGSEIIVDGGFHL
ncbi:SDR family NAD(P)-dependent oxidoreductase [Ructibacterium gallinarum]|uniref:SDR family oxidoreductase n=1 Tax=Ructibacterium gallinarum TaxID=2779355 RepID=A0A9D5M0C1_9FIRM|nr:SDR family oxidoreductase [Ructibacterium gallinarum]MBE5041251.1 SDR family oxidoreductase [Ructibacterium gallinarum]